MEGGGHRVLGSTGLFRLDGRAAYGARITYEAA
jgi:hypothetical protein